MSILGNLTEENVTKFLGIASEQTIIDFIKHIVDKNLDSLFSEIAKLTEQGVDLQHFAKQVLTYLDSHLFENIDLYLKISEQFGEILAGIRNYPYPALIYKIVLHKHIHGTHAIVEPVIKEPPVAKPTPAPVQTAIPQPTVSIKTESIPSAVPSSTQEDLWTRVINRIEK